LLQQWEVGEKLSFSLQILRGHEQIHKQNNFWKREQEECEMSENTFSPLKMWSI
jgi:hypothetical protein